MKNEYFTGVIEDPREEEQISRDYAHEERLGFGAAPDAFSNERITKSPYPYEDQRSTSECVPHAVLLALAIEAALEGKGYVRPSQTFDYRLRSNYPGAGCFLQNVFEIARTVGAPLYTTLPTPKTEEEANAAVITDQMRLEAAIFRGKEYYTVTSPTMDALGAISQAGKPLVILIFASHDEWARENVDLIHANLNPETAQIRHAVTVLPKSGHTDPDTGIRYLTVQDSAHFGGLPLRHVPEHFVAERVYGAAYWDKSATLATGPLPTYGFTRRLAPGARNEDVAAFQRLLISLGYLPGDCATGYFGGRTLAGLHAFQTRYASAILAPLGINEPTDYFGSNSMKVANQLCNPQHR